MFRRTTTRSSSRLRGLWLAAATVAASIGVAATSATAAIAYAVSSSTGELIRFDTSNPSGTRTQILPAGSLVSPTAMTLGPDGNLYIGESGDGSTFAPRITRYEVATR